MTKTIIMTAMLSMALLQTNAQANPEALKNMMDQSTNYQQANKNDWIKPVKTMFANACNKKSEMDCGCYKKKLNNVSDKEFFEQTREQYVLYVKRSALAIKQSEISAEKLKIVNTMTYEELEKLQHGQTLKNSENSQAYNALLKKEVTLKQTTQDLKNKNKALKINALKRECKL